MASREDMAEAARRFELELGASPPTARRIFRFIAEYYAAVIARSSPREVVAAASWAAQRLRRTFPGDRLENADLADIAASLVEGCPLCGGSGGPPRGSTAPQVPAPRPTEAPATTFG